MTAAALEHRNRRVGLIALAFALAMLGARLRFGPALPAVLPGDRLGGTTQRASEAEAAG